EIAWGFVYLVNQDHGAARAAVQKLFRQPLLDIGEGMRLQNRDAQRVPGNVIQALAAPLSGLRGMEAAERVVAVKQIARRAGGFGLEDQWRVKAQLPRQTIGELRFARARLAREQQRLAEQ